MESQRWHVQSHGSGLSGGGKGDDPLELVMILADEDGERGGVDSAKKELLTEADLNLLDFDGGGVRGRAGERGSDGMLSGDGRIGALEDRKRRDGLT